MSQTATIKGIFSRLRRTHVPLSNLRPSEWVEQNRIMTKDVSPMDGKFSFDNSPYVREIIDGLDSRVPDRVFAIMKGAQIGMSVGLIEGGIGWIMANDPGNILYLIGHPDNVSRSVAKVDNMITHSGLRGLIRSNSTRKRNTKSGDTDSSKEFPNGSLLIGVANHKFLRQFSVQYGFLDDYEGMKSESDQSGSLKELIDQRFAAYAKKKKQYFISTPELEEGSNIFEVYNLGDKRKYHIPCQCCGKRIVLEWDIISSKDDTKCGIIWDLDEQNRLIPGSVRYRCQLCNGEFTDENKKQFLIDGVWIPTCKPKVKDHVSYHISSLYAPIYMDNWEKYVYQYLEACPPGGERNEAKYKTFMNLVLGLPYRPEVKGLDAKTLMVNQRNYEIQTVPQSLSELDGNGKVLMLTMGVDIGGIESDSRLDYEIVAWTESGSSYSIDHGSIGTYQPRETRHVDRLRQSVDPSKPDNVWTDLHTLITRKYDVDNGKKIPIAAVSIDTGYMSDHAFAYYDWYMSQKLGPQLFMVKGHVGSERMRVGSDVRMFDRSREHPGRLYIVRTNVVKNALAGQMGLKWKAGDDKQPNGYMNFPESADGKYSFNGFFAHFEAEEVRIDKNLMYVWKKKEGKVNHQFDCRVYSIVAREVFLNEVIFPAAGLPRGNWSDFVRLMK